MNAPAIRIRAAVQDLTSWSFRSDRRAESMRSALAVLVENVGARAGVIVRAVDGKPVVDSGCLAGDPDLAADWIAVFVGLAACESDAVAVIEPIEVQVGRPAEPGLAMRIRGGGRTQAWLGLCGVAAPDQDEVTVALEAWCATVGTMLDATAADPGTEALAIRDAVMQQAGLGFAVGAKVGDTPFAAIRHWSPVIADLAAGDRAAVAERGLFATLSATEQQARRMIDAAREVLRRRERRQLEWRVRDRRGAERVLSVVLAPGVGDDPAELLLIAIDVTGRWNTVEVAHDFRGLLQRILGNLSLVERELATDGTGVADLMSEVRVASEHAVELCRSVLDDGHDPAHWSELELSAEIDASRALLRGLAEHRIELVIEAAPRLPKIRGDALRVRRLLINLVRNAVQAVGADLGTVRVVTSCRRFEATELATLEVGTGLEPGRYVTLEVADDGRGMDEATRSNALQPGYSTRADGHGVGLASVVDTVRSHRGGLALDSAPGRGARFTVLFPAVNQSTCHAPSP